MKLVSFDVETRGVLQEYALQPFRARTGEAWLTMCAIASKRGVTGQDKPTVDWLRNWLTQCAAKGITICGWNIAFDMAWLIALGLRDEVFACKWLDGMLLWKHLTAAPEWTGLAPRSYGLKAAVTEYMEAFAGYEEDVDFNADTEEGLAKLRYYNKQDAIFTLALCNIFLEKLNPKQRRNALIEASCLPMVAETHVEGILINVPKANALAEKLEAQALTALFNLKMGGDDISPEVLASPTKLRELLYTQWGLPTVKLTDKGAESTDRDALSILAERDPRASLLNEYRESMNNRTKFALGAVNSVNYNDDGHARPVARVFGTYTGRMTYSSKIGRGKAERPTGIALHQWKRDPDFRDVIEVGEDEELLEFDFAGQEYRWMAVLSKDATMLGLCADGEDAHGYMGAKFGGISYDKIRADLAVGDAQAKRFRQLGKVGNLSCIAEGQRVLTDRGPVDIKDVTVSDLLWDGVEWVSHDGVVAMGVKETITYAGITATPDHKVLINNGWVEFQDAARYGWTIEPSMGAGWACYGGSTLRVVGGVIRRALHQVRRAVRHGPMHLRCGEGREPPHDGDRADDTVQGVLVAGNSHRSGAPYNLLAAGGTATEACCCHVAAVQQPERPVVSQLRWAWGRVQVCVSEGVRGLRAVGATARELCRAGYRPCKQQRALRAGQPAPGHTQAEPEQQAQHAHTRVYDILNAGPRHRFTVNGRIVSNCQYRTSAPTLQRVARVQHKLKLSMVECKAIHATYQTTYPGVKEYWKAQIRYAKANGFVETVAGRRVHVGPEYEWTEDSKWGRESTAINFPIQGAGADQKYLALAILRDYLPRVEGRLYMELHDGIFVVVPKRHADRAIVEIRHLLSNLPYKKAWGVSLPVSFPVDAKRGPSWGQLKEVKL